MVRAALRALRPPGSNVTVTVQEPPGGKLPRLRQVLVWVKSVAFTPENWRPEKTTEPVVCVLVTCADLFDNVPTTCVPKLRPVGVTFTTLPVPTIFTVCGPLLLSLMVRMAVRYP